MQVYIGTTKGIVVMIDTVTMAKTDILVSSEFQRVASLASNPLDGTLCCAVGDSARLTTGRVIILSPTTLSLKVCLLHGMAWYDMIVILLTCAASLALLYSFWLRYIVFVSI